MSLSKSTLDDLKRDLDPEPLDYGQDVDEDERLTKHYNDDEHECDGSDCPPWAHDHKVLL